MISPIPFLMGQSEEGLSSMVDSVTVLGVESGGVAIIDYRKTVWTVIIIPGSILIA